VHTLGVGTNSGGPIPVPEGGRQFKRDEGGKVVVSKLNEPMLEKLAQETGGLYVPISSPGADPGAIAAAVSSMEQRSFDSESIDVLAERYQWPLALAALGLVLHLSTPPLREAKSS